MRRSAFLEALESLGPEVRRILVVDDDARFVRLVARFIQSAGRPYEVLRAYNGEDGLSRLQEGGVDAIVLDLYMPQMDGYTFLQRVRGDRSASHLPILVVTGRGYDVHDSHALSGNVIAIEYGRGLSNEEALAYLRAILETAQSDAFIAVPDAT
jgi:CheY-like chemotaxis protein